VTTPTPGPRMPAGGAVDLAALAVARQAQAAAEKRIADGAVGNPPAAVIDVGEHDFQTQVIDRSFQVPVIIDLWATWCQPCKTLSPILEKLANAAEGAWILAKVDVDASPRIAQAFQVQSVPSIVAVIKGQPVPLFQGALPEPQVRQFIEEVLLMASQSGLTGVVAIDGEAADTDDELPDASDPRFDAAFDAINAGDWDAAEAAYRDVLSTTPDDLDATAGISQVALLRRTDGVDEQAALDAASAQPDSLEAQALAADVELLSGQAEQAFARLIDLVRRTSGPERAAAREHVVSLFALIGESDPVVKKARGALASALY